MTTARLAFIGAGNMASAIIGGLINTGYPAELIVATDPSPEKRAELSERLGVATTGDNLQAAAQSDLVLLAVKPQVLQSVAQELAPGLGHQPLIVSIAAGIELAMLDAWLGGNLPMIRCMPNTPALVGEGASVLFANAQVSEQQRALASQLFEAVGMCEWIDDEQLMHGVTALSGSGPAYMFYLIEALQAAGEAQGLSASLARKLAAQTALGAARMVQQSELEPAQLKRNVMSPGGTTERGIAVLEEHDLPGLMKQVVTAASQRSVELGEALKGDKA
ncbi:MAG: pyrroline-5-carboxylate reductase [Oleiphilaceae bacterium]|nr:pyrroline-5-carboxylate reductase [Oleiphilaceae bacterium]